MGDLLAELTLRWARNIRAARARAGFTQVELAGLTGMSQQVISQYELGRTRPSDEHRILLAHHLGSTVVKLFPYPDDDQPANGDDQAAA